MNSEEGQLSMTHHTKAGSLTAKKPILTGALLAGSALFLAACGDKAPEGQVVAVVNGDEVTQQEVNLAINDARIPDGADEDAVRNGALSTLINRRLAAEIAREEGIDATPEYIVRSKQVDEALLVQMLTRKYSNDMPAPSAAEIDTFITENPQMFAERKIIAADQIRFSTPARNDYLDALADAQTLDQVQAALNRLGIRFERGNTQIDTATLDPGLYAKVMEVGAREPIVIPAGPAVTATQILRMEEKPIANDEARAVAERSMRQQNVRTTLNERLKKAKEEAGIDYQSGYGPSEASEDALEDGATNRVTLPGAEPDS
jgi:EpsD family peptidyl-prolyl cis-trans isomerase